MWSEFKNFLIWNSWVIKFNLISYCCTAARLGYSRKHETWHISENMLSYHAETTWQTKTCINLLTKCHFARRSASNNLSSQVTVSDNQFFMYESRIRSPLRLGALRKTYLNQISSHILSCLRRESLKTDDDDYL